MYYTVYKVTNQLNGKCYIGKHQTLDLDDRYMGSGKLIKRAIAKYGIENFSKEILHVFDSEAEMNAKEAEIVTEEFCRSSYNICPGGRGGFNYINTQILTPELRRKGRVNANKRLKAKYGSNFLSVILKNRVRSDATRKLCSKNLTPGNPKAVIDKNGMIYQTIKEYAQAEGITQAGATRRLKNNMITRI